MPTPRRRARILTVLCCSLTTIGAATLAPTAVSAEEGLTLTLLDRFETGVFDDGGSEIPAFDPRSSRFFVTNGAE